jgi:hypothetical protein
MHILTIACALSALFNKVCVYVLPQNESEKAVKHFYTAGHDVTSFLG